MSVVNPITTAFFGLLLLGFLFSGGGIFVVAGAITIKETIGQLWIPGERIEAAFSVFGLFILTFGLGMIGAGVCISLVYLGVLTP